MLVQARIRDHQGLSVQTRPVKVLERVTMPNHCFLWSWAIINRDKAATKVKVQVLIRTKKQLQLVMVAILTL